MKHPDKRLLILHPESDSCATPLPSLAREGYDTVVIHALAKMVRELVASCFDCLILDSDFGGIEEAIEIASILDPDIPVIVTAKQNTREQEIRYRQQHIFYYHLRDFGLDDLQQAIDMASRRESSCTSRGPYNDAADRMSQ